MTPYARLVMFGLIGSGLIGLIYMLAAYCLAPWKRRAFKLVVFTVCASTFIAGSQSVLKPDDRITIDHLFNQITGMAICSIALLEINNLFYEKKHKRIR